MVEVISEQTKVINMCMACGTMVSYVYTDLKLHKVVHRHPPKFYAYRYIECPVCKNHIEHLK